MITLAGSLLAFVLPTQIPGGAIEGKVVEGKRKPVACAQVVFFALPAREGVVNPVDVRTRTDASGQFRIARPSLRRDHHSSEAR